MIARAQTGTFGAAVTRPFYLAMSLFLAFIVVFGFSHTIPNDLKPPGLPIIFKLHAAIFVAWVTLFIAQPSLIRAGAVTWHRRLGIIGAVLALAMVILGVIAVLVALHARALPPFYAPGLFLLRNLGSMLVFAILVTAAILARRHPDWHKRLILCAAIVIAAPGLERCLPVFENGPHWNLVIDALIIVIELFGPAIDLIARNRIHPAYFYGIGAILCGQAVTDIFASAACLTPILHAIGAV
jgi:uncharacterized membrane protein YozB (DUF420 family)